MIRLGGVDEHFNLPVHLAIERGEFEKAGIDLAWFTFTGGTGQMTQALSAAAVDVCLVLTEGIVAAVDKGLPARIISPYTDSPLVWGIHTAARNSLQSYDDIFDKRYAISRRGSGSHLIAMIDARGHGRKIDSGQFVLTQNLDGARKSLNADESDVFYWEKFTTKPLVDSGELRRLGEFPTPWPAWMIAASHHILNMDSSVIEKMLGIIRRSAEKFTADPHAAEVISKRYGLSLYDAQTWLQTVKWSKNDNILPAAVSAVEEALSQLPDQG